MAPFPAKPFLKWAGGKTQLLGELARLVPRELKEGKIEVFVEPFVGGGAFFFHLMRRYTFDECHIFDINLELVVAYTVVRDQVEDLIGALQGIEDEFLSLDDPSRKAFYYQVREDFNTGKASFNYRRPGRKGIERTAALLFLNRTCYNGLYRENRKGEFNVPYGSYRNPKILYGDLLRADSEMLRDTSIHLGDFTRSRRYISDSTFVYFDPPYRPLNHTSSFTHYSPHGFDDMEQERLAAYFRECDARKACLMLSNSDPKNTNPCDEFFDRLYGNYHITRVFAKRAINRDGSGRKEVHEIIVTNYKPGQ